MTAIPVFRAIGAALLLAAAWAALAALAQPPPARVRGVVESYDGASLTLATKTDGNVTINVVEMTGINGLERKTLDDIGANAFIGATAVKDAAGRWKAAEIHIFPEAMRGAGEGHYAWDLPESTMTNGAVTGHAAAPGGRTLRVKHQDTETNVDVTPETAIVALTAGDDSLLVPGTTVFALVVPSGGGAPNAVAIIAETNGVKPPM